MRTLEVHGRQLGEPAGLAWLPHAGAFLVLHRPVAAGAGGAASELLAITPFGDVAGAVPRPRGSAEAVGATFDTGSGRLLLLEASGDLRELAMGAGGLPDAASALRLGGTGAGTVSFGGIAVDPATGQVFVLDAAARRILRLGPSSTDEHGRGLPLVGRLDLSWPGDGEPGALSFDPNTRHLFVLSRSSERLLELSEFGVLIAVHDTSALGLSDARGMVFAPSADLTDDSATTHLYIADAGDGETGRILEVSLAEPQVVSAAAAVESATLVQIIDSASFSPPSSDTSGLAWNSNAGRLIASDSELNERPYFEDVNVWETTFDGVVRETSVTTGFSMEPTGVAFNPSDGHFFFSDDDADRIFEARMLASGDLELVQEMNVRSFDIRDAEGVAYDAASGHLFVVDGVNAEIYEIAPGPDGVLDGRDETVVSFDLAVLGLGDPEGVEYDAVNDTLFIVDHKTDTVLETTRDGVELRRIDVSVLNGEVLAGIALAPSSDGSGAMHLYISDRGVDTDSPIDGRIYEIDIGAAPPPPPPPPPPDGSFERRVEVSEDDAEESLESGSVDLSSSDLELGFEASAQLVGLRFRNLPIEQGALVTRAYLQFTVDETNSEPTAIEIRGQASGDAAGFDGSSADLSSRPTTTAHASWSPPPWDAVGASGVEQQSADLSRLIEEVVGRADWSSGNSIVLLLSGTGQRVADSFDGSADGAPLLHVELAGVQSECGNGIAEGGEACDGLDLGGAACSAVGCSSGTPSCTPQCTLDYSSCTDCGVCGNGIRETGEECDGGDLGGASCQSLGFYCGVGGGLACGADCGYDASACIPGFCGDGATQSVCGEVCDGSDLGGESCTSQGFGSGSLACLGDCSDLDVALCSPCDFDGICEVDEDCLNCAADCFSTGPRCGNGVCEIAAGEDCSDCPEDCNGLQKKRPSLRFCCGDGDVRNPVGCEDPRCTADGFSCDSEPVPSSCCGDLRCDAPEDPVSCAIDCG
ncbi:MAG: SdiA-regulated domain-containing protein [Deltaproteobacteria bacterium]|nr:MAG: SdiA-regulated domain-containing protein [Deltaproteobacteria bacterium]